MGSPDQTILERLSEEVRRRITSHEFNSIERWVAYRGAARRHIDRARFRTFSNRNSDSWFVEARTCGDVPDSLMRPIWYAELADLTVDTRGNWPLGSVVGCKIRWPRDQVDFGYELLYRTLRDGSTKHFEWREVVQRKCWARLGTAEAGTSSVDLIVRIVRVPSMTLSGVPPLSVVQVKKCCARPSACR